MHRIWAGPASPAKGFFWHSIVLPQLADVVSNVAALLKATEDILTMVDLPEPAEKMHLPIPNVDLAHCNPQAWGGSLRSSLAPMWLEAFGLKGSILRIDKTTTSCVDQGSFDPQVCWIKVALIHKLCGSSLS